MFTALVYGKRRGCDQPEHRRPWSLITGSSRQCNRHKCHDSLSEKKACNPAPPVFSQWKASPACSRKSSGHSKTQVTERFFRRTPVDVENAVANKEETAKRSEHRFQQKQRSASFDRDGKVIRAEQPCIFQPFPRAMMNSRRTPSYSTGDDYQ